MEGWSAGHPLLWGSEDRTVKESCDGRCHMPDQEGAGCQATITTIVWAHTWMSFRLISHLVLISWKLTCTSVNYIISVPFSNNVGCKIRIMFGYTLKEYLDMVLHVRAGDFLRVSSLHVRKGWSKAALSHRGYWSHSICRISVCLTYVQHTAGLSKPGLDNCNWVIFILWPVECLQILA